MAGSWARGTSWRGASARRERLCASPRSSSTPRQAPTSGPSPYNRPFNPDAIFESQDELVPRILSTVADWYGILPHSMSEAVRSKPIDQLSPYEALLRAFGYYERVTPEEHAVARPILERAVAEAPGDAAAWAMLSMLYGEEYRFGFNPLPDPLGRSLQAARRPIMSLHP